MLCQNCGTQIPDNSTLCENCGATPDAVGRPVNGPNLVGFSQRINDPAFEKLQKTGIRKNLIIGLITSVVLFLLVQIFPFFMANFTHLTALIVGCILGGIGLISTLISSAKRASAKPWDGEVVDKAITKHGSRDQEGYSVTHFAHTITFKLADGGRKKMKKRLDTDKLGAWDMMTYLNIGDRVRYHGTLDYFEKYDKSRDTEVPCAGCRRNIDIRLDNCPNCQVPVIKP
jgi:hypothetical protein